MILRLSLVIIVSLLHSACPYLHSDDYKSVHYNNADAELFLNYGHKKLKDDKHENSVLKSKVEVLGEILKKHVELLRNTPNQRIELVFLVDSSASVGAENFFNELKFVRKLLADFTVSYETTRVSVVTFSSKNRVVRHIDHITNGTLMNHKCRLLEKEIPAIGYTGGGTYTLGAVLEAQQILNYARSDSKKAVFLITDGYSNGGDPRPAARRLRDQNVEMFTFGIRNGNVRELFDMASEPQQEHSYIVDSFEEFEALARRALHEDLPSGGYLTQERSACWNICSGAKFDKHALGTCCDPNAQCSCGTHAGLYACLCNPGYFGTGLYGDCRECPAGTYKNISGPGDISSCTPCPSKNHIAPPGSTSVEQCTCKPGYFVEKNLCRVSTCPALQPPDNGYFIKNSCSSILNAACGLKCNMGYTLSGSHIRLCQEDGTWSGNETKCIVKKCPEVKPPKNGIMSCTKPDPIFDAECEFSCDDGYMLIGSKKRTCLPISVWTGVAAFCRPIQCQPLKLVVNGTVSPARCTEAKNKYGDACEFKCKPGYELRGPAFKSCSDRGKWTDETQHTKCIDVSPPVFTCPGNIEAVTEPDENFATVVWDIPEIYENSRVAPYLTSIPAVEPPMRFRIGSSRITYLATDSAGNKAECSFDIFVKDTQPPTIDRCDSPPTFLSRDRKIPVIFEEPIFSDNSGKAVRVVKSYDSKVFPLGETVVTYTAFDEALNTVSCNITVVVQEHACQLPPDPIHGSKNCTQKADAVYCTLTCVDGYAFASRPPQDYFCAYDGVWKPNDNPLPFPDCSVTAHSNAVIQDGTMKIDAAPDFCNDPFLLTQVEHHVRHKMMNKMTEICGDSMVCELESLQATCNDLSTMVSYLPEDDDNELSNDLFPVGRYKREVEFEATTLAELPVAVDRGLEINVNFTLKSSVDANASVRAITNLESLESGLKEAVTAGDLDFELGGKKLPVETITFGGNQKIVCEPGSLPQGDMCVRCPVGTFFNVITEVCQACPQGTFQSDEGKLACMVCPENTSTKSGSAKVAGDCKAQCLPGTFSADGLEACSTCPVGKWQVQYTQKECLDCPNGTTTLRRGTRRVTECKGPCKPGEVSETGLLPCYPCPLGYYQSQEGQTFCVKCPVGMTTAGTGNAGEDECIPEPSEVEYESIPEIGQPLILEVNDCFSNPCQNVATCSPLEYGYVCLCSPGFTGMSCETNIDECSPPPCGNNGVCIDGINGFSCECAPGYTGSVCETDIDDCFDDPCQNSGTCVDKVGDFTCECRPGFTGAFCEVNIDDCLDSPCLNGGTCIDGDSNYTCSCEDGFVGLQCEEDYDDCSGDPCQNGGTCVDQINAYRCECLLGFSGDNCESETDECESNPCEAGATCEDLTGDFKCLCPPAKGGKKCEKSLSPAFVLHFSNTGSLDYATTGHLRRNLSAVTLCFWMNSTDKSNYGTAFSYATAGEDNSLTLTDYSGFVFYINGKKVVTDVTANDGTWHLICAMWSSAGGAWSVYKDGEEKDSGVGLANQTVIPGGGVAILGQEQDQLGGGFSPVEAFLGQLYHLELWDHVLSSEEVKDLYESCDYNQGNVIAWPDFKTELRGRIMLEDPTFCRGCPMPKHLLYGQIVHEVEDGSDNRLVKPMVNVTYTCEDGYKLSAEDANRTCLIHGSWSGVDLHCSRVSCGFPGYTMNGNVAGKSYLFGDKVSYACKAGYRLKGNVERFCRSNGTWDGETPVCEQITCSLEAVKLNRGSLVGNVSGTTAVIGEKIAFTCEAGYMLDGPAVLTCLEEGTWDDISPVCQPIACSNPPTVDNGFIVGGSVDDITAGTILRYECKQGYFLSRGSSLMCSYDGTWIGEYPSCEVLNCGKPDEIPNGVVETSGTSYGSIASYICDDGYELDGEGDGICSEDGSWDPIRPTCIPVECGSPEIPDNSEVLYEEVVFGSTVSYGCYGGFQLVGPSIRRCLNTGQWSEEPPVCIEVVCSQPEAVENGQLVSHAPYSPGDNPVYVCDSGYQQIGNTPMCTEEGHWDHGELRCEPLECPSPPVLGDGYMVAKRKTSISDSRWVTPYVTGTELSYFCNDGFKLIGGSTLTCLGGYGWTDAGSLGTCEPVKCPSLPNLEHGFAILEGFDVGKAVEFQCETGFELQGDSKRICLPSGMWDGEDPECVIGSCSKLLAPVNGFLEEHDTVVHSIATYQCNPGYMLEGGDFLRECEASGEWTGKAPRCSEIRCLPTTPLHGTVDIEGEGGLDSVATYKCNDGYRIIGPLKRTCGDNGEWNEAEPSCQKIRCSHLSDVENGQQFGNESFAGASVVFECKKGYEISGVHELYCRNNGTWSHDPPVCQRVTCPHPGLLKNGKVSGLVFQYNSSVEYSCHPGFDLQGEKKRFCQSDRTWSGAAPKCEPKKCPELYLQHGLVNYTNPFYKGVAKFTCDRGFNLIGAREASCDAIGKWNQETPLCQRITCEKPNVPNAVVTEKTYDFGDEVEYTCDTGFKSDLEYSACEESGQFSNLPNCEEIVCPSIPPIANGNASTVATRFGTEVVFTCEPGYGLVGSNLASCFVTGHWSSHPPVCSQLLCSVPPSLEHGEVSLLESYSYGALIAHSCDENYVLIGRKERECGPNGDWLSEPPVCERIVCPPLPQLVNGNFDPEILAAGDTVNFICNEGYLLNGSRSLSCLSSGEWSGTLPTCNDVKCVLDLSDTAIIPSSAEVSWGKSVHFSCPRDHHLTGARELTCTETGVWNSPYPLCTPSICPPLKTLENGKLMGNNYLNAVVTYSCDPGFVIVGSAERKCLPNLTWSTKEPVCTPVKCPQPEVIQNGELVLSGTTFEDKAEYSCDTGYNLLGEKVRTCIASGEWDSPEPSCDLVQCSIPVAPEHGDYELSELTPGSSAVFSCKENYILEGSEILTCLPNGEWNDIEPACVRVLCQQLSPPVGGKADLTAVSVGSRASYSCDSPRRLLGSATRICQPSGVWSGAEPTCELLSCPPLASNSVILDTAALTAGTTVSIRCAAGYKPQPPEVKTSTCSVVGVWDPEPPQCVPVNCGKPERPENGNYVNVENTTFGAEAQFYCHEGFRLEGSPTASCNSSGLWSVPTPRCHPIVCLEPPTVSNATFIHPTSKRDSYGSVILIACSVGLRTSGIGPFVVVCQGEGEWKGNLPVCLPSCPDVEIPANGRIRIGGDVAHYDCDPGFDLLGTSTRFCNEEGSWSDNEPQCQRKWCPEPQPPPGGYIMGIGRQFGDMIRYVCPVGTVLEGEDMAACEDDGTWTQGPPTCKRQECGRPPTSNGAQIQGQSFAIGDQIVVSCPYGYRPVDGPVLACNESGHWSGIASCGAHCDRPCKNGGICLGRGRCSCPPGFTGERCQTAQCIMPCLNGGTCVGPYNCACKPGYAGSRCEKPICETPCQNGGRCVAANQCSCPLGYLKPDCAKKMAIDKFRRIQPAFRSLDRFTINRRIRQQWP